MPRNEFAIVGAGAIGSILAAHLARSGHEVTVLARGARAQQVQTDGLRISGLNEICTRVRVLTDPSLLRRTGTLIIATKTPGSEQALERLRHVQVDAALSIQNGLLKNELLARTFGADRTLGALANTSGELLASGEVLFTRNVNLFLGELTAGTSERARHLARTIDDSGVRASAVPDILAREWSKFSCMSALQDLLAGRRLEVEETFGYAVRKAKELHVPLPLLDTFYRVVGAIDRTRA